MPVQPVSFFSGALYSRKTCNVYTPPGYDTSDQTFPVIYMLHGMHGTEISWIQRGQAVQTLDRLIADGELDSCIVVFPNDGEYGQGTFYLDWYDGTGNFEQYIVEDLIPYIDSEYRTIAAPEGRMVGGYSMGGFGAFSLALRHSGLFSAAASLSGALGAVSAMSYRQFSRSEFARMVGPQKGAHAQQYDLAVQARLRQSEGRNQPALYFDCGADDQLYPLNLGFHQYLDTIQYPHEYREFSGGHTWEYWTEHLPDTLRFFQTQLAKLKQS